MMTLAEHIIEAMPERIKRENLVSLEPPLIERTDGTTISPSMSWLASYLADVDHLPSAAQIRFVRLCLTELDLWGRLSLPACSLSKLPEASFGCY